MNELCHLWRSERYEACGDDGRKGPFRAKRPRFPGPLLWGPRRSPAKRNRGPRGRRNAFRGERSRSKMSELSPFGGSEGYGACGDEGRGRAAK